MILSIVDFVTQNNRAIKTPVLGFEGTSLNEEYFNIANKFLPNILHRSLYTYINIHHMDYLTNY